MSKVSYIKAKLPYSHFLIRVPYNLSLAIMSNKIIMAIFVIGEQASSEITISKTKSINALKRIIISKLTANSHEWICDQQVNIWKANLPETHNFGVTATEFLRGQKDNQETPLTPSTRISSHFTTTDIKVEGHVHVIAEVIHKGIWIINVNSHQKRLTVG